MCAAASEFNIFIAKNSFSCPRPHSLADDLLDELVQEVSLELGQLCDSCVEQLYSHEFARPSDTPS